MATSRYAPQARTSDANTTDNKVSSQTSGNQNSAGTSTANTSTQSSGTQVNQTNTNNMSASSQAALETLIAQLLAGGTPEQKAQAATRRQEIGTVREQRSDYSKENAFIDASGLINQQTRRTLEQLMPSISRAAEDAGSSGGALRALLLQDAANKAAESGAAAGANLATAYGGISTNLSAILERLTQVDPTVANALVGALGVAKGAQTSSSSVTQTEGTQNSQQIGTENKNINSTENKLVNQDFAPFQSTTPTIIPGADGVDYSKFAGTTLHTLAQLSGNNPWANYTDF